MSGHRGAEKPKVEDLDAIRRELAAWRRAQPLTEQRPGTQPPRSAPDDLDLSPLRRSRPLRAAPPSAEDYVADLRSQLIDLRAPESDLAR